MGGVESTEELTPAEETSAEDTAAADASAGDTEAAEDSEPAVEASDSETLVSESYVAENDGFSITIGEVQYGEDGSNENGNLDKLFAPVLLAGEEELELGEDYSVSYSFTVDGVEAELSKVNPFVKTKILNF